MVVEARRLVDEGVVEGTPAQALDAFGYEEAARHVYGMTYDEWKRAHQKKVTDEQMIKFDNSKHLWANHDKALLQARAKAPDAPMMITPSAKNEQYQGGYTLQSNVCCQDAEQLDTTSKILPAKGTRDTGAFNPPQIPDLESTVKFGILTISDRAFGNEYSTGDISGPAIVRAVHNMMNNKANFTTAIVPDETNDIQQKILEWSNDGVDIILSSGGTGMSPRDITPEATRGILDQECAGLMNFVTIECSKLQPLASLSRGTAGIRGNTIIANLPGNPKAVDEIIPILLPLLMHAFADMNVSKLSTGKN